MRPTIKDIANKSGFSTATVSRAINDPRVLKPKTLKKIKKVIDEMGFHPNKAARSMVKNRTHSIGLMLPRIGNQYWATVSEYVQDYLWEKGYSLIVSSSKNSREKEIKNFQMFSEHRVDGIIYSTSDVPNCETEEAAAELLKYQIPLVAFDRRIPGIPRIRGDHFKGALTATNHLVTLGHNKIAFLGGPLTSPDRETGYRKALDDNRILFNERLIRLGEPRFEFGHAAVKDLVQAKTDFSAIFCGSDLIAFGAINALNEMGIRVPEDIAVVGYDDIPLAPIFSCPLTTVQQPIEAMSKKAVELLLEIIEGGEKELPQQDFLFSMNFVVRKSCGAEG